jgi:hypothetical protein
VKHWPAVVRLVVVSAGSFAAESVNLYEAPVLGF